MATYEEAKMDKALKEGKMTVIKLNQDPEHMKPLHLMDLPKKIRDSVNLPFKAIDFKSKFKPKGIKVETFDNKREPKPEDLVEVGESKKLKGRHKTKAKPAKKVKKEKTVTVKEHKKDVIPGPGEVIKKIKSYKRRKPKR